MTVSSESLEARRVEPLRRLAIKALDAWGMHADAIRLIKYRENAVFQVDVPDGQRFALRIHRPGYHSAAALRSELQWMTALSEAGVKVPRLIPTTAGELYADVGSEELPEPHQVDLFEWIHGQQLGSIEDGITDFASVVRNYFTIGEIAARVHNQAAAWDIPEGFVRHAWDMENLVGEQPLWGRFWELESLSDEQRDLLCRARDRVKVDLTRYGQAPDQYSMIHADLTPENLMVDEDGVRLIDFDDAGYGWHLFELATALYFVHREPRYAEIRDALFAGYRQHRALSEEQAAALPLFMTARGFTYLGWVHTRPETRTAREMTPHLVDLACGLARDYLAP